MTFSLLEEYCEELEDVSLELSDEETSDFPDEVPSELLESLLSKLLDGPSLTSLELDD